MNKMITVLLFLVSFVYMGLEMLSIRIITPYFGSTVYTWGSIISVFLIGSGLGYWFGGKSADRADRNLWIKRYFIFSSINIALLPYLGDLLLPYFRGFTEESGIFFGVAALFILPNALLSALIPGLTKMGLTRYFSGERIGSYHLISSIGSVLGTLITTFILLPNLHLNMVLVILVFLLAVSLSVFVYYNSKKIFVLLFLVCILPYIGQIKPFAGADLVNQISSPYHELYITESKQYRDEKGNYRFLQFSTGGYQGGIDLDNPERYLFPYVRNMSDLLDAFHPSSRDVYMIGHGVGSLTKKLSNAGKRMEVAELDEKVLEASKRYFGYTGNEVSIGDGRILLSKKEANSLDVLLVDAFTGGTIPYHLTTQEFFRITRQKLKPDGIMIINVIGKVSNDKLVESFHATLKSVYPNIKWFASNPSSDSAQNLFIVASGRELGVTGIREAKEIFSIGQGPVIQDKETNNIQLK